MYSLQSLQATKTQQLLAPGAPLLMAQTAHIASKPWELAIKCSAINNLQRNVPFALTITNFWQLYPREREYTILSFPKELCQGDEKAAAKDRSSDRTVDLTNALHATFEIGLPQPNGTIKYLDQAQLSSVFILRKHNPWTKLKKGSPISLRLYFLRLPSDFEHDAESSPAPKPREFHFCIKFNEQSTKTVNAKCFAKALIVFQAKTRVKKSTSNSPSPTIARSTSFSNLSDSPRSLKRSKDSIETNRNKKVRSGENPLFQKISSWSEFFLNMGITDGADITSYVQITEEQKIVDWTQLARIPIETLQHLGFKLSDIAKIRTNYNRSYEEADEQERSQLRSSSSSVETSSQDSGSDLEYSNDEEEIALQLLLLHSSYSASPPPSPLTYRASSPSTTLATTTAVSAIPQSIASPLSVNRVVHLTIKLGKLIICEVKDASVDLKARLALADEVESLLVQWLHTAYPSQRLMNLDEVRELTEQPTPPYDPSLAYYIKVFSAHLELKENNRGILKREHLLLPMEDVAKLLGLSLTKISREYQRGCVLGCGWILKGRKRSLRWPSRPLHVLLGHISEKILRETTAMYGGGQPAKVQPPSVQPKHLALLASASDALPDETLRSAPLPINCY